MTEVAPIILSCKHKLNAYTSSTAALACLSQLLSLCFSEAAQRLKYLGAPHRSRQHQCPNESHGGKTLSSDSYIDCQGPSRNTANITNTSSMFTTLIKLD
jgi:hypothetical protein